MQNKKPYIKADYTLKDVYKEYCKICKEPFDLLDFKEFKKNFKDYFTLVFRHIYKSKISYSLTGSGLYIEIVKVKNNKKVIDMKATKNYWNLYFPDKSLAEVRDHFLNEGKKPPYKYYDNSEPLYKINTFYNKAKITNLKCLRFEITRGSEKNDVGKKGLSSYLQNVNRTVDFPYIDEILEDRKNKY